MFWVTLLSLLALSCADVAPPPGGYGSSGLSYRPTSSGNGDPNPGRPSSGGSGTDGGYGGTDIGDTERLVRSLEEDLKELQTNVGSATTLCAVGAERLSFIRGKKITALELKDLQHEALIDLFKGEIKDQQHRADAAQAEVDGSAKRVIDTGVEMDNQAYIVNLTKRIDDAQNTKTRKLLNTITEHKETVTTNINGSIAYLEKDLYDVQDNVAAVHEFVESRNCEYGFFSLNLDDDSSGKLIDFRTKFDDTPDIAVSHVGFSAHLNVEHYGDKEPIDVLAFDKFVGVHADAYGFEAKAVDSSKGRANVKMVYCSFMACQNINDAFMLPHSHH